MEAKKIWSSKTIIILILLIVLILSIIGLVITARKNSVNFGPREFKEIDTSVVFEKMERISELSTIKYYYSDVIAYKNKKKLKDFDIPFTEKSFLIKYDGYIKAGTDAGSIKIVSEEDKSIKLIVKNSKVLDHVVDESSLYVYDEKSSIFNELSISEVFEQIVLEKSGIEEKLIEKGFLKEADNNLKSYLEDMLRELGYEQIEIFFEAGL